MLCLVRLLGAVAWTNWINDKLERNIPNQGTTEIGEGLGQPRNQELQVGSSWGDGSEGDEGVVQKK